MSDSAAWIAALHKPNVTTCIGRAPPRRASDAGKRSKVPTEIRTRKRAKTMSDDPRGAAVKMWADREDGRLLGVL